MLPALPCDLDDRYTLTAELGRGSHAIVYRALDRHLEREVAVKILREELIGSDVSERFQREIRLTSKLEHPNIAHVYGTGEFLGKPYFVIALARGSTLGERLRHERQLPVPEAISIVKQVASALQHAHAAGIIHRDVKPENILLTAEGALLSDFGVARALEAVPGTLATSTGTAVGTLLYMSPEQLCAEKDIDARSDQYALALVLYEILAGVPAHSAANAEGLRGLRIVGQHAPLRTHRPTVPEHVELAVQQALSPSPADRFANMSEFVAALDGAVTSSTFRVSASNRTVPAATIGATTTPAGAWRRWALGGAALATMTVVGVLGATLMRGTDPAAPTSTSELPTSYAVSADGDTAVAGALVNELSLWSPDIRATVGNAARGGVAMQMRITPVDDGQRVSVQLNRAASSPTGAARVVQVTLPRTQPARADSLRLLAARVLMATIVAPDSAPVLTAVAERPMVAVRDYSAGWRALLDGELDVAEARFAAGARTDRLPQASLWQAILASWRSPKTPAAWRAAAVKAASTAGLSTRDSLVASALMFRADDQMDRACGAYVSAAGLAGGSFEAWYGLADCLQTDSVVVVAPGSPTGFRFRSSYWSALQAYENAIDRLPSARLVGLFDRLPSVALARNVATRRGVLAGAPTRVVLGFPSVDGDSVSVFPILASEMGSARGTAPLSYQVAVRLGRTRLLELSRRLAERVPSSFTAQLNYARALELLGILRSEPSEPSALALLLTAERIASAPADSVDAGLVRLRVHLRLAEFDSVASYATRLLLRSSTASPSQAAALAPVAVLMGRVADAEFLLRRALTLRSDQVAGAPPSVAHPVAHYQVAAAIGFCDSVTRARAIALRAVSTHYSVSELSTVTRELLESADWSTVTCPVSSLSPGTAAGAPIMDAIRALRAGDDTTAMTIVRRMVQGRSGAAASAVSWDTRFSEISVLVQSGDSLGAHDRLMTTMDDLSGTMDLILFDAFRAGAFRRSLALCDSLSSGHAAEATLARCGPALRALSRVK